MDFAGIALRLRSQAVRPSAVLAQVRSALWTRFVLAAVYGQILLGGLVASNYAALACTEFPKCQGQWFPDLVGPVGIHMIHRFGAYAVAINC